LVVHLSQLPRQPQIFLELSIFLGLYLLLQPSEFLQHCCMVFDVLLLRNVPRHLLLRQKSLVRFSIPIILQLANFLQGSLHILHLAPVQLVLHGF
jgi:hypothetical protein